MGPEPEPPSASPSPEPDESGEPARPRVRELTPEPALPRGCNPLTFGVVMATLEMALLLGLWLRCR
jgi:hypothetical protein